MLWKAGVNLSVCLPVRLPLYLSLSHSLSHRGVTARTGDVLFEGRRRLEQHEATWRLLYGHARTFTAYSFAIFLYTVAAAEN